MKWVTDEHATVSQYINPLQPCSFSIAGLVSWTVSFRLRREDLAWRSGTHTYMV